MNGTASPVSCADVSSYILLLPTIHQNSFCRNRLPRYFNRYMTPVALTPLSTGTRIGTYRFTRFGRSTNGLSEAVTGPGHSEPEEHVGATGWLRGKVTVPVGPFDGMRSLRWGPDWSSMNSVKRDWQGVAGANVARRGAANPGGLYESQAVLALARRRVAAMDSHPGSPFPTVLIADIEPDIRALFVSTLRDRGFNVLEAPDWNGALRFIEVHSRPIHVLLTGVKNAGQAASIQPYRHGLRLLFVSDCSDSSRTDVLTPDAALKRAEELLKSLLPSASKKRRTANP